jgi:hypothetical protein
LAVKALAVILALLAASLVAFGAGLVYLPAGLIVGGLECACLAYMAADLASTKVKAQ